MPGLFQSLEQFVERDGVVDGGESIEIARGGFMGNLGSAVEVGNAPAERTPGHAAFAVALLAPVDAEVVAVTANDGHAYVVKFANNPQSLRVLANEWLACSIGRAIGVTIPEPAILYVPAKLVESSPSLVIQLSSSTLKCSHGMAFGSRFISEGEVFDYLPDSVLPRIDNVEEFAG